VLFEQVAATSATLARTSARGAKTALVADLLSNLQPAEIGPAVTWLSGDLTQRQIVVGYASLRSLPDAAAAATLTVADVESRFEGIKACTGAGSQARRRELIGDVFGASTAAEQQFLRGLLSGGLRQGALTGVVTDAVARAAAVPPAAVRRAAMLRGELAEVATVALTDGIDGLARFGLEPGRPIGPMLAQSAADPAEALQRLGGIARFEWKLDGARIQVHRRGADVAVFTRTLDDITTRVPEIVEAIRALPVRDLVADGEAIALRPDGRPYPFQVTASRFGTSDSQRTAQRLTGFLFDVLHVDGVDLLDEPGEHRWAELARIVPQALRVPSLTTSDAAAASAFLDDALAHGHEGVVAKSLASGYEAGRRGSGWIKIKPVHTLDLVVLAVEWGSGRRRGWLSNIHLGARDPKTGEFVMLGKTFKGMTDQMLAWQTERFTQLASGSTEGWVVSLRPEQVVEIAFDGVQRSTTYPGGVALRFARVLRYRDDKRPDEIDTINTVRGFLPT